MDIQEKRKLAHEYALELIKLGNRSGILQLDSIAESAWSLADLMQAQEKQRTTQGLPDVLNPVWQDAPDWAKFRAMDKDGSWYYYKDKPWVADRNWQVKGRNVTMAPPIPFDGVWRDSLHERA